ncbi:hypothetical protein EYF80_004797 [Liparis tanakae]|uniref:Uncharacterized protein n=1 Tax=Liparis tanakae TaxID=230148 RepID=A0A4Z2J5I7_9TELE|nr:hypothetical protein EYF80_004797 [Liparis tanakae]
MAAHLPGSPSFSHTSPGRAQRQMGRHGDGRARRPHPDQPTSPIKTALMLETTDRGSGVEQRPGLFTQLWGSPGPGEREDVFRASLIMAASEEINRPGPAGMLQLLPLVGGRDGGEVEGKGGGVVGYVERPEGREERRRWTGTPGDTP